MALTAQVGQQLTLLDAVTGTGTGTEYVYPLSFNNQFPQLLIWETRLTGSPTGVTADIETSLNGTDWYSADTHSSTSNTLRWVVDKPILFIRANLTTLTGGSAPTVTVILVGLDD